MRLDTFNHSVVDINNAISNLQIIYEKVILSTSSFPSRHVINFFLTKRFLSGYRRSKIFILYFFPNNSPSYFYLWNSDIYNIWMSLKSPYFLLMHYESVFWYCFFLRYLLCYLREPRVSVSKSYNIYFFFEICFIIHHIKWPE